jgi:hypothetical protein
VYGSGTRSLVPRIRRIIAMIRADRSEPSVPFAEAHCESMRAARRATYQAASEPARNEGWLVYYTVRALCTRNKSMPLTKAAWKLIGHSRRDFDRDRINPGWSRMSDVCSEVKVTTCGHVISEKRSKSELNYSYIIIEIWLKKKYKKILPLYLNFFN